MSRFEEFWAAWPHKKAKGAARKAWKQVKGDTIADEIIAAIPAYTEYVNSLQWMNFAHPATWLRAERWEDEYEPTQAKISPGAASFLAGRKAGQYVN